MALPAKRKVLLRKGMKFSQAIVTGIGKSRRIGRVRHVGPCEVEMTELQIKRFKDLLQTAPQVVASEPVEPEDGTDGTGDDDKPESESKSSEE